MRGAPPLELVVADNWVWRILVELENALNLDNDQNAQARVKWGGRLEEGRLKKGLGHKRARDQDQLYFWSAVHPICRTLRA